MRGHQDWDVHGKDKLKITFCARDGKPLRELFIRSDGQVKNKEFDGSRHGPKIVLERIKRNNGGKRGR